MYLGFETRLRLKPLPSDLVFSILTLVVVVVVVASLWWCASIVMVLY